MIRQGNLAGDISKLEGRGATWHANLSAKGGTQVR